MQVHRTVFCVLLLGAAISAEEWQRAPSEHESLSSTPTLEQVRKLLAARRAGEDVRTLGPIRLGGFNFSRELDIGHGQVVVAVSCNLGGGLMAYNQAGELLSVFRTWEIAQLQLVDLDSDGRSEIVTLQKDGAGTGISIWNYHLFALTDLGFEHLWSGVGSSVLTLDGSTQTEEGFIRVLRPKLVHLVRHGDGREEESMYVMRNGRLERQEPAS